MNFTISDIRAAMTILQLVVFGAIVWWAFSGTSKERFRAASQIPLRDDDDAVIASKRTNDNDKQRLTHE